MTTLSYKPFYRRNLPHVQPLGATFFVTFRLRDSLPKTVINRLVVEREKSIAAFAQKTGAKQTEARLNLSRKLFAITETCLDSAAYGPTWLKQNGIAEVVAEGLRYRDGKIYDLDAYCIMSNHVHVVFKPIIIREEKTARIAQADSRSLARIMQSLKGNTAIKANRILERTGAFWEHESFDHYIREEKEWQNVIRYVLNNPVKAGLVREWTEWRWSYCRYGRVGL